MTAPRLTTPRLILDAHRGSDLEDLVALWSDAEVVRHIGGRTFSREEAWQRLLRYAGHWALNGYGFWAVRSQEDGRFLGEIGFADFKRTLDPPMDTAPEAGWVFAPDAHGRGLAGEALGAALAWAEMQSLGSRVTALIEPANGASIRLAGRHGFVEALPVTYGGRTSILFERPLPLPDGSAA